MGDTERSKNADLQKEAKQKQISGDDGDESSSSVNETKSTYERNFVKNVEKKNNEENHLKKIEDISEKKIVDTNDMEKEEYEDEAIISSVEKAQFEDHDPSDNTTEESIDVKGKDEKIENCYGDEDKSLLDNTNEDGNGDCAKTNTENTDYKEKEINNKNNKPQMQVNSQEKIVESKETEIKEYQKEVTETIKSTEIEDEMSPICDGKFLDDTQGDEKLGSHEDVEECENDEKNITSKTDNSDVCVKESNDSEIEQEKIDEIEDDQTKSEASNPLGNATEETVRGMEEDSSQEEIIEIKETEIDDPLEEGTETIKSTEITEEAGMIESAMTLTETAIIMICDLDMNEEFVDVKIEDQKGKENNKPQIEPNSQEDDAISSDVEEDENEEKNITTKT